jgi:hypothetical protein
MTLYHIVNVLQVLLKNIGLNPLGLGVLDTTLSDKVCQ